MILRFSTILLLTRIWHFDFKTKRQHRRHRRRRRRQSLCAKAAAISEQKISVFGKSVRDPKSGCPDNILRQLFLFSQKRFRNFFGRSRRDKSCGGAAQILVFAKRWSMWRTKPKREKTSLEQETWKFIRVGAADVETGLLLPGLISPKQNLTEAGCVTSAPQLRSQSCTQLWVVGRLHPAGDGQSWLSDL